MSVMRYFVAFILARPFPALADEIIHGPITAVVVSVYDGDTLDVDAHPWPGMTIRVRVRLESIAPFAQDGELRFR
jgi:endonuclease YncB( thermonuclease family)